MNWRPKILAGPPAPGDGTNDWLAVPAGLLESASEDAVDWTTRRPSISYSMDGATLTIYGYPSCIAFHKRCTVWVEAVDPGRHRCRNSEPLLRPPGVNPARACRGFGIPTHTDCGIGRELSAILRMYSRVGRDSE